MMEYCELCKEGRVTQYDVLIRRPATAEDNWNISYDTKDICDKCFNLIKRKETKKATRFIEAQKRLDGQER